MITMATERQHFTIFFVFLLCFCMSRLIDAEGYSTFPQLITHELGIRYFSVKKGHRFRGKISRSIEVYNAFACLRHCMKDSCTSVNFQEKTRTNGLHVCELIISKTHECELQKALVGDSNFNFISLQMPIYKDCLEVYKEGGKVSGVYSISPSPSHPIQVYCDMVTSGGGWTVIQKRIDGSVDFYRHWADYKQGFGNKLGEYWLGLDNIHRMTSQRSYRLRVDMADFEGNTRYAEYGLFKVADEGDNYRLTVGSYSGDAGDALRVHDNLTFSTKDRDNDNDHLKSCAVAFEGAWWYNNCLNCNPNGYYYKGCNNICPAYKGIYWEQWHGGSYSMKRFEMKIRPNS